MSRQLLAGVTQGLNAAPRQPTSLWASCLCLPARSNEVPEGTTPQERGPGSLPCPCSASVAGFPGQGAWSGSWATEVRLCLSREPRLEVLE